MVGFFFVNVDSFGVPYNTTSTYSTYAIIPNSIPYSPNAYNVSIPFNPPLQNISKIYLKSFSTPILFPNVRASSKLNFLLINCDGVVKTITLNDKIYTSISSLIADLNTASTLLYPSDNLVFSLDSNTGNVRITSTSHPSVIVNYSNLGYLLGFRVGIDIPTTNNCLAAYLYNLALDSYINMYISNISGGYSNNTNGVLCSFRIPINASSYNINYSSESMDFANYITNSNPHMPITNFNIVLLDRFGYNLHANGADFSAVFGFEKLPALF